MKKIYSLILVIALIFLSSVTVFAKDDGKGEAENIAKPSFSSDIEAKSVVLMEADSKKVLYEKNPYESYSPASVTKIMTLLIVAEAIAEEKISATDKVTISDKAAGMGGSQVFLKEGEVMSVEELLKCCIIASANDAAYALAEYTCGSENQFVAKMNARAMELELKSTNFENVTGLDDTTTNHVSSAYDISIMSRELIKHEIVLKYSNLWQDTIRNGEFTLTNTNRLVRFYDGCNGLKTGSTDAAGYCVSATAKRDGMQLIAVIMGANTRDERNQLARELLDFGFSNYTVYRQEEKLLESVPVYSGLSDKADLYSSEFSTVIEKGKIKSIEIKYNIPEYLNAPITAENGVGSVEYYLGETKIGESIVFAKENIEKISFFELYLKMLVSIFNKTSS